MSEDWKDRLGIVFSTNNEFEYNKDDDDSAEYTPCPTKQLLYVSLDRKKRKGKNITLIEGFLGTDNDIKELAKKLKQKCGVGGSSKDGEILIQGDFRDKIINLLHEMGYKTKQKGG